MNTVSAERPLSTVLQDIVRNTQDIIRSEVRLAKTELTDEIAKAREATLLVAIGAVAGFFAVGFVLLGAVYALALVMAAWLAALIVAVSVGILAAAAISAGLKRFKRVRAAPKTVASLKENVEWAKQQTK
jgi:uncharacterized membrane protein